MTARDTEASRIARELGEVALKIAIARAMVVHGAAFDLRVLEEAFASVKGAARLVDVRDLEFSRQRASVETELEALRHDVECARRAPAAGDEPGLRQQQTAV